MSICTGVRVEDMGHKMGCNGVDNGERTKSSKAYYWRVFALNVLVCITECNGVNHQGHTMTEQGLFSEKAHIQRDVTA